MGIVAKVLSFARVQIEGAELEETKGDGDGGAPRIFDHTGPGGDDSPPLPGDFLVSVDVPGSGNSAAVAYADTRNAGLALPGEKRIYGRDENGAIVCSIRLRRDGSIEATNAEGSYKLSAAGVLEATVTTLTIGNGAGTMDLAVDGTWTINGLIISPAGEITNAAGIVLGTHTHAQDDDSGPDTQVETDAPT